METRWLLALVMVVLLATTLLPLNIANAQDLEGRWAMGITASGNMWYNDYNKRVIGEGGDVAVRYGFTPNMSVGVQVGYAELKSNQDPSLDAVAYLKLRAIPASVVGWYHFAPDWKLNPYVYAGLGAMIYLRMTNGHTTDPDGFYKGSIHLPLGAGFETFMSKDLSLAVDVGYTILNDIADGRLSGNIDGYGTAKVGINFYFGRSAREEEAISRAEAQRIIDFREAKAQRLREIAEAEAKRVRDSSEAQRMLDSTRAEEKRQADLSTGHAADTVFFVVSQKTVNLKGINFETNTATLTENSSATLTLVREALKTNSDIRVLIVGHTDDTGRVKYNKDLSLRRAKAVRSWLVREGISSKRLSVAGDGPDNPIDNNATPEGRANNRRIEFRVVQ